MIKMLKITTSSDKELRVFHKSLPTFNFEGAWFKRKCINLVSTWSYNPKLVEYYNSMVSTRAFNIEV